MESKLSLSPLQLKQLIFTEVSVATTTSIDEIGETWAPDIDLEGVTIKVDVSVATHEPTGNEPEEYVLTVRLSLPDGDNGKSPYRVKVGAIGVLRLHPSYAAPDRAEVVRVNGSSIVIGAMREMVSMVTGRCLFGPLTLPTLRFHPKQVTGDAETEPSSPATEHSD